MLSVTVACVGTLGESYWRAAASEYQKRLGAFCKMTVTEVPEYPCPGNPSAAQMEALLQKEGQSLLAKIPDSAYVVALCVEGERLSSPALAAKMAALAVRGTSRIVFVVGGSFGLSAQVKSRADALLSLSDMTFPHQLARILLMEQIYRAFQIEAGGKYHK